MDEQETLWLSLSWPVSTIDGEPSLTKGSLTISNQPGGGHLLCVTSGDECHPDGVEVQFPLSAEHGELVRRALAGEVIGEVKG